ncbi:transporter substrate-binding domain-containing protein [Diplocloster hominis]|uniref:transporter substrate-binding domain-containing protein n=1 Tax=Diplocloster hominis TaxID=3079010 RepID=UPI0031BAB020
MRKSANKVRWLLAAFIILTLCFMDGKMMARAGQQDQHKTETIRVGFFEFEGYHMIDSQGKRSGYGYDYLQYLARYTDFSYEYVGYDKSWSEMQDMLEAGEIDLLTSASKTPERLERFDFSDQPIGSSAAVLTVKAGNNRYMVDDYSQLDGIRIGLMAGNSRNENLRQFAQEHNFTYVPVYYKNSTALSEALQKEDEIDAVLTSDLRKTENEWVVATFDDTPFYIMVRKGNQKLLDQVNRAIEKLKVEHKDLESILTDRYYTVDSGDEISFTAKERNYIKSLQESGQKVKVTINSEREPASYFVDGEARGILPEIAKEVMSRTGLPYEFVETPPTVDARELLAQGEADVRFDGTSDFHDAESRGLRVTDPYLELPLSVVTLKNFAGHPKSVAVMRNSDVVEEYAVQLFGDSAIARYDTTQDCLDAVLNGRQDAAFFQTYIAQRLVNTDARSRFREQLVPGYGLSFAVSVSRDNALLFSVMDKAVLSMSTDEINRIVLEQTSDYTSEMSLIGFLYAHPVLWLLLLGTAACFAIILILYIYRQKNLRLEREKAREQERFISYVCRANDQVIEIESSGKRCRYYQVEDGRVSCREKILDGGDLEICGLHPEDKEGVDTLVQKENMGSLAENGEEVYFECRVRQNPQEPYQWFSYTLQGVPRDEQTPDSLMVFIKNIDRAKREEQEKRQALKDALAAAQQGIEARGTFMSRMSHEIRTPLNAILGYLTIAGSNLQNQDKMKDCLNKSEFAARQLLNIVNDVLDISAIESGKMKIANKVFNIRELLSGITSIFHTQASQKGVDFRVRISDLTEEELVGDQFRLNQILMNILSNAVKFTPEGGRVTLSIQQQSADDHSVYLQFRIKDSGIGMPKGYESWLFQPFEQQDATTAQKFGGTGLGLSITKNLIAMMNGTVDVKSEEGQGSLFTVNLSFGIPGIRQKPEKVYDFSSLHVLVLFDENSDYQYLETLLSRLDIQYDLALNTEDALKKTACNKANGGNYDLCLIDWDSPEVQGEIAAEQILEAAAPDKPTLIAVAYVGGGAQEAEGLIDDTILKPVFQSSLFDVLSNVCRRHTLEKTKVEVKTDYGLKGRRILLAEDNELNMEIAKEILTGYGLEIDGVVNGQEAVERFEASDEGTYQAILMDIQMPVLNGYAAAQIIRAGTHPQAAVIPIIALTADAFVEDINRALAAGMNGHVSKPIDFPQLCETLAEFL